MKNKKEDTVGEFFFDEKTGSLHQRTKTGFDSTKWRNLDQKIEENLKKHFEEWAKKNQKQVELNLTLKDNYGLFLMAKNGSKSILKNIVAISIMRI